MGKIEKEWFDANIKGVWFHPEGYPETVKQMIIAKDEETGVQVSMSIWEPGTQDTRVLKHDNCEICFMVEGEQVCNGQVISPGMVTIRPPFMPHGPFGSPNGCKVFEVFFPDPNKK